MAPKANQPSKKTEQKQKAKIIEDKTFGLKNKNKSTKVNKYVQQVEKQVKEAGQNRKAAKEADAVKAERERKKLEEKEKLEMAALFKPVVSQPKVAFGVDPKTVLCAFWKASGTCQKGDKCKFSHDTAVERKSAKINLYEDSRDAERQAKEADTMDQWDQDKLEQVVQKKHHGPGIQTTTDIVCKFFLDAIEQRKYGWFWECPNGGDKCKYRHALPPGYVLKRDMPKAADGDEPTISLEEFLETERFKIDKKTPVTADTFAKWKQERKAKAAEEAAKAAKTREAEVKAGRLGHVSGRDLFTYSPDLFRDDDEAMDVDYTARDDEYDGDNQTAADDDAGEVDAELFENLDIDDLSEEDEDNE